MVNIF